MEGARIRACLSATILAALIWTVPAYAQNPRGSATGPTKNPGYGSRDQFGFISNNPPVYDVLPKAREALQKLEMGKRPAPQ